MTNQINSSDTDGVSKGNGSNTNTGQFLYCLAHFVLIPRIAIRISERHGNISDDAEPRVVSFGFNRLQYFVAVFDRLVLVFAQKRLRNGVRKTQGVNCFGADRALNAFLVYDDADD